MGEIRLSAVTEGAWAGVYTPMLGLWEDGRLRPDPGGPLCTGDVGRVDEDGTVFVVDRKKSIINRGGANVSPAEVEQVLMQHPGARQCVVLGVPDERLGERVVALVAGDADPAALVAFCRERLAGYKVPREIRFEAIPKTSTGKIQKFELRERAKDGKP